MTRICNPCLVVKVSVKRTIAGQLPRKPVPERLCRPAECFQRPPCARRSARTRQDNDGNRPSSSSKRPWTRRCWLRG
eukprot:scaffold192882_cov41-Prasinocladus_malaysianus.AAC.1